MTQKGKRDNRTHAQKRRAEYQEQQREYLRGLGLIEKIIKDVDDLEHKLTVEQYTARREGKPETSDECPQGQVVDVQALRFKTETRLKLLSKILPDLKQTEIAGPDGGPLPPARIKIVGVKPREG